MGVEIDSNADAGMPEPLLRDLRVYASCQHVSCVAVTQVMQSNSLQIMPADELHEGMGERSRLQRLAVCTGDNVVISGEPDAKL